MIKVWFVRDSVVARNPGLLMSIRCIGDARKKRRDNDADPLAKLRKVFEDGRTFRVEAHVAEWCEFCERMASLTGDLESNNLE